MAVTSNLTYTLLTGGVFLLLIMYDLLAGEKLLLRKRFHLLLAVFTLAMLLFDTYLTGLPIITYSTSLILGFRIGTIPLEDFFYGLSIPLFLLNVSSLLHQTKAYARTVFWSSRPFSWINTAYPAGIGIFLARQAFVSQDLLLLLFLLFPYNLILYGTNDVYDFETDKRNPRKQSIEGGLLPPNVQPYVLWLVILFIVGGGIVFSFVSTSYFLLLYFVMCITALMYSMPPLRLKRMPILDSLTS